LENKQFGNLSKMDLRSIWPKESSDFTPWLADNLDKLGDSLGLQLELVSQESPVGNFSLDLQARELGTNRPVVIENQLTQTDHDHLGKLLTYAAGTDASFVIWLSQSIREEHHQALEWLNQRTNVETNFFGVVVEVLQIDDSLPAYRFRSVVTPNGWQKSRRSASSQPSPKAEAYRAFFQGLIDELREEHQFTGAKLGQPQNWYSFASGFSGINFSVQFNQGARVSVQVYIEMPNHSDNEKLLDFLFTQRGAIETEFGSELEWDRMEENKASRILFSRSGSITDSAQKLNEIRAWVVENLLNLKKVFGPYLKGYRETSSD
jgi:hypothetical protein